MSETTVMAESDFISTLDGFALHQKPFSFERLHRTILQVSQFQGGGALEP